MKKNLNPLSRANTRPARLVAIWAFASTGAVGFLMLSKAVPATLLAALPLATICQGVAVVTFATLAYRTVVPCPVCKYGKNAPTADAWTCPHCKIGFKAAEPEPKREGAGPWE